MKSKLLKMTLLCGIALSFTGCSNGTTASDSTVSDLLGTATTTPTTTAVSSSETAAFAPGVGLYPGQSYVNSANQTLIYQADGNLVIYDVNHVALWWSHTAGDCSSNCYMVFQTDGNLVLYSGGSAYWSTNTASSELATDTATQLVFNSSAPYLQIADANNVILWSSTSAN